MLVCDVGAGAQDRSAEGEFSRYVTGELALGSSWEETGEDISVVGSDDHVGDRTRYAMGIAIPLDFLQLRTGLQCG